MATHIDIFLVICENKQPITSRKIADELGVVTAQITAPLDRMLKNKFICRTGKRRKWLYSLPESLEVFER